MMIDRESDKLIFSSINVTRKHRHGLTIIVAVAYTEYGVPFATITRDKFNGDTEFSPYYVVIAGDEDDTFAAQIGASSVEIAKNQINYIFRTGEAPSNFYAH